MPSSIVTNSGEPNDLHAKYGYSIKMCLAYLLSKRLSFLSDLHIRACFAKCRFVSAEQRPPTTRRPVSAVVLFFYIRLNWTLVRPKYEKKSAIGAPTEPAAPDPMIVQR